VVGGVLAEGRQRVLALDPVVGEVTDAAGADRQRPVALGADEDEADTGMVAQGRDQPRVERFDPLQRNTAGLARERDQAESARGHHR
jgi:hypothetical protein